MAEETKDQRTGPADRRQSSFGATDLETALENAILDSGWIPAVDVGETDSEITLRAEVPGLKAEDLHIECENGLITIRGERSEHRDADVVVEQVQEPPRDEAGTMRAAVARNR